MEGSRFVADYLSNSEPKWIILSEEATSASRAVANDASEAGIDILEIPPKFYSEISDTAHSQGIIAVCTLPEIKESEFKPQGTFLLLDRISDPGNIRVQQCDYGRRLLLSIYAKGYPRVGWNQCENTCSV